MVFLEYSLIIIIIGILTADDQFCNAIYRKSRARMLSSKYRAILNGRMGHLNNAKTFLKLVIFELHTFLQAEPRSS